MLRNLFSLALVFVVGTAAQATLHTFEPGTFASGSPLTISAGTFDITSGPSVGGGSGETYDFFQMSGLTATADGRDFFGHSAIVKNAESASPADRSQLSLLLYPTNPLVDPAFLELIFTATTLSTPLPHTSTTLPEVGPDGNPNGYLPTLFSWRIVNNPTSVGGVFDGASVHLAAVPEPSAFLFGGLVAGVLGVGRWCRGRKVQA